jgi:AcrR family transcriptional regulator
MAVSRQVENRRASGRRKQATDPRANQRRRTKAAIMEATRKLIREGKVPSVADAAAEAGVSRATAYRYFPTQGALVREAVDAVLIFADEWEERLPDTDDLVERVERLAADGFDLIADNEALMRGYLLVALAQWAKLQAGEELGEEPIERGGRRHGIGAALQPFEDRLDAEALRKLEIGISLLFGIESRIVIRDIWDLDDEEAKRVTLWIARVLAEAALDEGGSSAR